MDIAGRVADGGHYVAASIVEDVDRDDPRALGRKASRDDRARAARRSRHYGDRARETVSHPGSVSGRPGREAGPGTKQSGLTDRVRRPRPAR